MTPDRDALVRVLADLKALLEKYAETQPEPASEEERVARELYRARYGDQYADDADVWAHDGPQWLPVARCALNMREQASTPDPAFDRIAAVVRAAEALSCCAYDDEAAAERALGLALDALTPADLVRCGVEG